MHLNGFFCVSPDRQGLWRPDSAAPVASGSSDEGRWNQLLFRHGVSKAYANVLRCIGASLSELSAIARKSALAQLQLRCDTLESMVSHPAGGPSVAQFWRLFPAVDSHDGFKAEIATPVYEQLHSVAVLPFARNNKGFSLVAPIGKATYIGTENKTNLQLWEALLEKSPSYVLVEPPSHVAQGFELAALPLRSFGQEVLLAMVREKQCRPLLRDNAEQCLEYLLQQPHPGSLAGAALAVTHDGELRCFDAASPVLLLSAAQKSVLGELMPERVLSMDCEHSVGAAMSNHGGEGLWCLVDAIHFVQLFISALPTEWNGTDEVSDLAASDWIASTTQFWAVLSELSADQPQLLALALESVIESRMPIVPTECGKIVPIVPRSAGLVLVDGAAANQYLAPAARLALQAVGTRFLSAKVYAAMPAEVGCPLWQAGSRLQHKAVKQLACARDLTEALAALHCNCPKPDDADTAGLRKALDELPLWKLPHNESRFAICEISTLWMVPDAVPAAAVQMEATSSVAYLLEDAQEVLVMLEWLGA